MLDSGTSCLINLAIPYPDTRRLLGCLLTVGMESAALSRADRPAASRQTSHHLMIDEFCQFMAQSEETLTRMLSETRKYDLFCVMAHQNWSQASDRLKGALQNVGLEVILKAGRMDAEYSARLLAAVDPLSVKHTVADEDACGAHPPHVLSRSRSSGSSTSRRSRRFAPARRSSGCPQTGSTACAHRPCPRCDQTPTSWTRCRSTTSRRTFARFPRAHLRPRPHRPRHRASTRSSPGDRPGTRRPPAGRRCSTACRRRNGSEAPARRSPAGALAENRGHEKAGEPRSHGVEGHPPPQPGGSQGSGYYGEEWV